VSCPAGTEFVDAVVPQNGGLIKYHSQNFGSAALVYRFRTPANDPFFSISLVEATTSNPTGRQMSLSQTACGWTAGQDGTVWAGQDSGTYLKLSSATQSTYARVTVQPSTIYYFSVRNLSCAVGCDVIAAFSNSNP
jgi:hypothetical protein